RLGGNGLDVRAVEQFGYDDLIGSGIGRDEAFVEIALRACRELGVTQATVPTDFPLEVADHLRANGVELEPSRELFEDRRRSKTEPELAGIRRAQRATEAAMSAARDLLRRAEPGDGVVLLDGEPLTCERIKAELGRVFSDHNTVAEEMIVSHGPQ